MWISKHFAHSDEHLWATGRRSVWVVTNHTTRDRWTSQQNTNLVIWRIWTAGAQVFDSIISWTEWKCLWNGNSNIYNKRSNTSSKITSPTATASPNHENNTKIKVTTKVTKTETLTATTTSQHLLSACYTWVTAATLGWYRSHWVAAGGFPKETTGMISGPGSRVMIAQNRWCVCDL